MSIDPIGPSAQPFDQHGVLKPIHGESAAIPIIDRRVNQRLAKLTIDFRIEPQGCESGDLPVVGPEADDAYKVSSHFSITISGRIPWRRGSEVSWSDREKKL
jgi:hypothetical protein